MKKNDLKFISLFLIVGLIEIVGLYINKQYLPTEKNQEFLNIFNYSSVIVEFLVSGFIFISNILIYKKGEQNKLTLPFIIASLAIIIYYGLALCVYWAFKNIAIG